MWRHGHQIALASAGLLVLFGISARWNSLQGQEPIVAFRGAAIETMSKLGRLEDATLVIQGDKILSVGTDTTIPASARVVDVQGKTILPGLIDPYHVISTSGGSSTETRTVTVRGRSFRVPSSQSVSGTTFSRIADSYYPYTTRFDPLLRSGLSVLNLVTRGYGQGAVARLVPEEPDSMLTNPNGLLFIAATNNSTSLNLLRTQLAAAASGGRAAPGASGRGSSGAARGTRPPSRGSGSPARGSGPPSSSSSSSSAAAPLWKEIVEGKKPLIVNVNNAATVLHVFELLKPYKKVKLVLVASGSNLYETFSELEGQQLTLVLPPTIDTAPYSDNRVCLARMAHEAGIPFAFSLSLDRNQLNALQDDPLLPIAYMVKVGLPREAALKALTTTPAAMLGLSDTHGTIEPGKKANLIVFDGDPLERQSRLKQVWVEGSNVYEN